MGGLGRRPAEKGGLPKLWIAMGWLVAATLLLIAGCIPPRPEVRIYVDPPIPLVNELVWLTGEVTNPVEIVTWEWSFGDGTTGTGEIAWHQYRSINGEALAPRPWTVELRAIAVNGTVGVDTRDVWVQPMTGQVVGYCIQEAGTVCKYFDQVRPTIPTNTSLDYRATTLHEGYWSAPTSHPFYLLLKLHLVLSKAKHITCRWTLFSLGISGDEKPEPLGELRQDTRIQPNDGRAYAVGFPIRIDPTQDLPERGWYQVFAEITSTDTPCRNIYDFTLCVGGKQPS